MGRQWDVYDDEGRRVGRAEEVPSTGDTVLGGLIIFGLLAWLFAALFRSALKYWKLTTTLVVIILIAVVVHAVEEQHDRAASAASVARARATEQAELAGFVKRAQAQGETTLTHRYEFGDYGHYIAFTSYRFSDHDFSIGYEVLTFERDLPSAEYSCLKAGTDNVASVLHADEVRPAAVQRLQSERRHRPNYSDERYEVGFLTYPVSVLSSGKTYWVKLGCGNPDDKAAVRLFTVARSGIASDPQPTTPLKASSASPTSLQTTAAPTASATVAAPTTTIDAEADRRIAISDLTVAVLGPTRLLLEWSDIYTTEDRFFIFCRGCPIASMEVPANTESYVFEWSAASFGPRGPRQCFEIRAEFKGGRIPRSPDSTTACTGT